MPGPDQHAGDADARDVLFASAIGPGARGVLREATPAASPRPLATPAAAHLVFPVSCTWSER